MSAEISDINSDDALVSTFGANPGIGDTGVHLCCYNLPGYEKLSKPQQDELHEWIKIQMEEMEEKER